MGCLSLADAVLLPDMGCNVGADPYRQNLRHLLRVGDLWDIPTGGTFDRLLLGIAEEYARFHTHMCQIAEDAPYSIGPLHDWRLSTYNRILSVYGLDAVATDHDCDIMTTDNADTERRLWGSRYAFLIIITVPKLSNIPMLREWFIPPMDVDNGTADSALVREMAFKQVLMSGQYPWLTCLYEYRQSHTSFLWREHPYWLPDYDVVAADTDNTTTDTLLYDRPQHGLAVHAHPSFHHSEIPAYFESPLPLRSETRPDGAISSQLMWDQEPMTTDDASCSSYTCRHRQRVDITAYPAAMESPWGDVEIHPVTTDDATCDSWIYEHPFTVTAPQYVINHPELFGWDVNKTISISNTTRFEIMNTDVNYNWSELYAPY